MKERFKAKETKKAQGRSTTDRGRQTGAADQTGLDANAGRKRRAGSPDSATPAPPPSKRAVFSIPELVEQPVPSTSGAVVDLVSPAGDRPSQATTGACSTKVHSSEHVPGRHAGFEPLPTLPTHLPGLRLLEKRPDDPVTMRSPSPPMQLQAMTPLLPPSRLPESFLPAADRGEDRREPGAQLQVMAQLMRGPDPARAPTTVPPPSQSSGPPVSVSQESAGQGGAANVLDLLGKLSPSTPLCFILTHQVPAHLGPASLDGLDLSIHGDVGDQGSTWAAWYADIQADLAAFAQGDSGGTEPDAAELMSQYIVPHDGYWDGYNQYINTAEAHAPY
ncbi:hypothetical protein FRC10_005753 [Ceratobasidium sp. 414]|nr:hypothetical protein FRC10_005753 [Ceratobasidium sp. 414]